MASQTTEEYKLNGRKIILQFIVTVITLLVTQCVTVGCQIIFSPCKCRCIKCCNSTLRRSPTVTVRLASCPLPSEPLCVSVYFVPFFSLSPIHIHTVCVHMFNKDTSSEILFYTFSLAFSDGLPFFSLHFTSRD